MLGARIALLRRNRSMSQSDLARALGISASAVGMYEQGRREPPLDIIIRLAELFGVSTDYLLRGETVLPRDLERLRQLYTLVRQSLNGQLFLRNTDGSETPVCDEDLALTLAAILG